MGRNNIVGSKLVIECQQGMLWLPKGKGESIPPRKFTQTVDFNEGDECIEFSRDDVDYTLRYRGKLFGNERGSDYDFIGECEIETYGAEDPATTVFRAKILAKE